MPNTKELQIYFHWQLILLSCDLNQNVFVYIYVVETFHFKRIFYVRTIIGLCNLNFDKDLSKNVYI